jgi:hypothetical protein
MFTYFEDQVSIEIDDEGCVSICCPDVGSREFLLDNEQLAEAEKEIGRWNL